MSIGESLLPLASFAFVSSITPGPNNLMLAASGAAFGWRRTIPHVLGIPTGFAVLLVVSGVGVGALVAGSPTMGWLLKLFGSAYLLYLTWVLRSAFAFNPSEQTSRPIRFHEALLFQFVNPKAWIMAVTAVAVFMPTEAEPLTGLGWVVAVCVVINLPCILTWIVVGLSVRRWLDGRGRVIASGVLIVLMLYTVVAIWL